MCRRAAVSVLVLSATGCAAKNTFIQPDDSSAAKLRVVQSNPDDYGILIGEMDIKTCQLRSQVGFLSQGAQTDSIRVGMLDSPPVKDGVLERRIPVGEPFAVVPQWFVTMLSLGTTLFALGPAGPALVQEANTAKRAGECRFPVFVPQQGEQYELTLDIAPGKCDIALQQLVQSASQIVSRQPVKPLGAVLYQLGGTGYPEGKCEVPKLAG